MRFFCLQMIPHKYSKLVKVTVGSNKMLWMSVRKEIIQKKERAERKTILWTDLCASLAQLQTGDNFLRLF